MASNEMAELMTWLFFALLLDRVQLKLTSNDYLPGSFHPGYGIIDRVLKRKAYAPMAYRVLVPWLIGWNKENRFVWLYEPVKILLMAFSMWAASLTLGTLGGVILGILYCSTFWSDYWDVYVEVGCLALALTGQVELALLGAVLLGLSRETAPLVGVTYALVTGDIGVGLQLFAVSCAVLLAVRLYIGKKELYCERMMWRRNIKDLKTIFDNRPVYLGEMTLSVIISVLILIALSDFPTAWPVPLALLVMGWLMGRAAETRIFAGCFLWLIPILM